MKIKQANCKYRYYLMCLQFTCVNMILLSQRHNFSVQKVITLMPKIQHCTVRVRLHKDEVYGQKQIEILLLWLSQQGNFQEQMSEYIILDQTYMVRARSRLMKSMYMHWSRKKVHHMHRAKYLHVFNFFHPIAACLSHSSPAWYYFVTISLYPLFSSYLCYTLCFSIPSLCYNSHHFHLTLPHLTSLHLTSPNDSDTTCVIGCRGEGDVGAGGVIC